MVFLGYDPGSTQTGTLDSRGSSSTNHVQASTYVVQPEGGWLYALSTHLRRDGSTGTDPVVRSHIWATSGGDAAALVATTAAYPLTSASTVYSLPRSTTAIRKLLGGQLYAVGYAAAGSIAYRVQQVRSSTGIGNPRIQYRTGRPYDATVAVVDRTSRRAARAATSCPAATTTSPTSPRTCRAVSCPRVRPSRAP